MTGSHTTCWTIVRGAAAGRAGDRRQFAERYLGVVRAYLIARWRGTPLIQELDDAIQEVFVESFRPGGALERVDAERASAGFRGFLLGVVRNVARRIEQRQGRGRQVPAEATPANGADETLSRVFDRAWARTVMREAAARQRERAAGAPDAEQRVELLRLRFHEDLPIRRIAELWGADPEALHREYARARREFRAALTDVVAFHHPGAPAAIDAECVELVRLLGE
ncbi:MAG: sigma-70 family RNA polymerase sigma factor [Phycisphaerales bacterium]|nr:sigma-70 family RNA polymerase sigma factor [Phycisphaerales bacterium]